MLTSEDLQAIRELLREIKTEVLVEMSKLRIELLARAEKQNKQMVADIDELLNKRLVPILDNHEKRIDRLEKQVGLPPLPPLGH